MSLGYHIKVTFFSHKFVTLASLKVPSAWRALPTRHPSRQSSLYHLSYCAWNMCQACAGETSGVSGRATLNAFLFLCVVGNFPPALSLREQHPHSLKTWRRTLIKCVGDLADPHLLLLLLLLLLSEERKLKTFKTEAFFWCQKKNKGFPAFP